jgi:hypothetical protein
MSVPYFYVNPKNVLDRQNTSGYNYCHIKFDWRGMRKVFSIDQEGSSTISIEGSRTDGYSVLRDGYLIGTFSSIEAAKQGASFKLRKDEPPKERLSSNREGFLRRVLAQVFLIRPEIITTPPVPSPILQISLVRRDITWFWEPKINGRLLYGSALEQHTTVWIWYLATTLLLLISGIADVQGGLTLAVVVSAIVNGIITFLVAQRVSSQ